MKSKKRQKPFQEEPKPQFDKIQADHELFLQAFEKPTQIYRYLRTRAIASPTFLHRNLSYMTERSSRKANTRDGFKVNIILDKVEAKHKKDFQITSYKSEYMNLTFTGFFDEENQTTQTVEVEPILMKICHKKRKDVSSPVLKISLGNVSLPCNPECASPSKAEAIAVGSNNFSHSNGHTVRSYKLLLNVTCAKRVPMTYGLCNGDINESADVQPPPKRRKSRATADDDFTEERMVYGSELVVYDKHKRCLLTEGDYEVGLQDVTTKIPKQATWETVSDGKAVGPFEVFNKCPTLKFKLNWNQRPLHGTIDNPDLLMAPVEPPVKPHNHHINNHLIHCKEKSAGISSPSKKREPPVPRRRRIFYQFLYNNNTRQQTEARDDCHCPWCSLGCFHLFSLLKHLRTSHPRFNFTYVEHQKGARIDVSINDSYDGSYGGNPQDLHSHIGFAFSRIGPARRTPVTHLIVYKPKKPDVDLAEFMEPEAEPHSERQFIQGHNRLYFHTVTQVPIRPQEIDMDSEAEHDPLWLQQKTQLLIDEFTDVNEGEKEVMKMWNLHIMRYNFIGDCQLLRACHTFVEEYGPKMIKANLTRNFLLHLVNLYDFSLVKSDLVFRTVMQLQRLREQLEQEGLVVPTGASLPVTNGNGSMGTMMGTGSSTGTLALTAAASTVGNNSQDSHQGHSGGVGSSVCQTHQQTSSSQIRQLLQTVTTNGIGPPPQQSTADTQS